jgi:O-antigen ligase
LFLDKPLLGHWASTAGPGSHQFSMDDAHGVISEGTTWFNPENQFLQWLIEYGALGFLLLALFYVMIIKEWWKAYQLAINSKMQSSSHEKFLLWARVMIVIWLLALFAEWMVLHSFADRMVVYPLFALMWMLMSPINR